MSISALLAGLGAGIAVALVYLLLLWLSVAAAIRRGSPTPLVLGTAARLVLFILLGLALFRVRPDATSVLAAALGFVATRLLVIRRVPTLPDGAFSEDA